MKFALRQFTAFSILFLTSFLTASAQTQPKYFVSYTYTQDDLPSGFDQGIFNPATSGKTVYLDKVVIDLGLDANDTNAYVIFGAAVGLSFPSGCTTYSIINTDLADPGQQAVGGVASLSIAKIVGQPCTGMFSTGNLGATNPSVDHFGCIANKNQHKCVLDMSTKPLALLPGRGYYIYSKPSFLGTPVFGFEWHEL